MAALLPAFIGGGIGLGNIKKVIPNQYLTVSYIEDKAYETGHTSL